MVQLTFWFAGTCHSAPRAIGLADCEWKACVPSIADCTAHATNRGPATSSEDPVCWAGGISSTLCSKRPSEARVSLELRKQDRRHDYCC
jgi:hypothetical protein